MNPQFCSDGLKSPQERFYQYILVSQLETIEAVTNLDKQSMTCTYKIAQLENSVTYLMNRVNVLEETVKDIRNANVNSFTNDMFSKSTLLHTVNHSEDIVGEDDPLIRLMESSRKLNSQTTRAENDMPKYPKKSNFFGKNFDDLELAKCAGGESSFQMSPGGSPNVNITNYYHQQTSCCCQAPVAAGVCEGAGKSNLLAIEDKNEKEDKKEVQRMFNKRVKYEVNRKFGDNYLFDHQVRELDVKTMAKIRNFRKLR